LKSQAQKVIAPIWGIACVLRLGLARPRCGAFEKKTQKTFLKERKIKTAVGFENGVYSTPYTVLCGRDIATVLLHGLSYFEMPN